MSEHRRCAVVYNPTKVSDTFVDTVNERLAEDDWTDTLWLETTAEDPGSAMTAQAREAAVDLVLAAGGDGTVRMVASGLADSGIPLGVVPAGTGNLLARNLGLPLDQPAALEVALAGHTRTLDLVEVSADEGEPTHFAVLAGVGVDAMIMDEVNPELKKKVGSVAYFIAAGKALGRLPVDLEIILDERRTYRRRAMICAVGNVGELPGNISLIPDARPDDGQLDVYVASPHRFTHWIRVLVRLITLRRRSDDRVDQWRASRVELRLRGRDSYQLDGDVVGECRKLVAEIRPGALVVCVPVAE